MLCIYMHKIKYEVNYFQENYKTLITQYVLGHGGIHD